MHYFHTCVPSFRVGRYGQSPQGMRSFSPTLNYTSDFCSRYSVIYVLFVFEQNSPGNLSMSNQPGTPREDGEMGGNFLNPFQSESVSEN